VDKQQPTSDDITKNLDHTREALLDQRREQAFGVFVTNLQQTYEKQGRIRMNRKAQQTPGGLLPG
jgi:peptidyl-prolyl cis-trans isomerase D